jgi:hypothetical protein
MTKVYHILRQKSTMFAKIIRDLEIIFTLTILYQVITPSPTLAPIHLPIYE